MRVKQYTLQLEEIKEWDHWILGEYHCEDINESKSLGVCNTKDTRLM